ncbi:unnamed protein product [Rhizophagus irregularis]|nr:unnamed protein product [Rhizophagus irregularis]
MILLLAEIDKTTIRIYVSCISKSVVQEEGVLINKHSIMAYMDDTQWITDEKSKVGKNFGREEINIKAKHPHEPMRILECIFNIEHDGNYLMFKIKNEIDHLVNLIVEYWSQVMALSKTQTEALIILLEECLKTNENSLRSAPNAIMDNPYIYGYRDFYDNQLQAKITDFCIQLNDNGLLVLNMLLLCYDNNISLQNVDNNIFQQLKEIQIISGDKSRLLLWKKYLLRLMFLFATQRKEAKWYTDIRSLITLDNIHLSHSIRQLLGAFIDNVDEARSY